MWWGRRPSRAGRLLFPVQGARCRLEGRQHLRTRGDLAENRVTRSLSIGPRWIGLNLGKPQRSVTAAADDTSSHHVRRVSPSCATWIGSGSVQRLLASEGL